MIRPTLSHIHIMKRIFFRLFWRFSRHYKLRPLPMPISSSERTRFVFHTTKIFSHKNKPLSTSSILSRFFSKKTSPQQLNLSHVNIASPLLLSHGFQQFPADTAEFLVNEFLSCRRRFLRSVYIRSEQGLRDSQSAGKRRGV